MKISQDKKMASSQDIENESGSMLQAPFIKNEEKQQNSSGNDSLLMVLISTFVAIMGSFEFGSCVSFSIYVQTTGFSNNCWN